MAKSTDDKETVRLFATVHFKSKNRPDGYTLEEIEEINNSLNISETAPTEIQDIKNLE